jgi:glucosamine--fructose-6-phosphate aminotransferase (isomerizing)
MCGVVAVSADKSAASYLLDALRRLEYRGYDSVGVAIQTIDGGIATLRTVDRVGALDLALRNWTGSALHGAGIGHTRWATHGTVNVTNAHPHADCTGRISLVHNGIITNADDLRWSLERVGHNFTSAVDSEVISHLIEERLKASKDLVEAIRQALEVLEGSWAIAVLEEGTGRVVVAVQGSPLLLAHTTFGVVAASDITAMAEWADEFRVLEDGDIVELGVTSETTSPSTPVLSRCIWRSPDIDLNGYADHMAKEIDEQPVAAARVIDELANRVASGKLWRELDLPRFDRLQIVGCGTSLNAGNIIGNLARRLAGVPTSMVVASEAAVETAEPHTLRLAISQSGETADVLHAVRLLADTGSVVAITNNSLSTLARSADAVISCAAGPEIGVAATKTFVCQVIAGSALMISALVASGRLAACDAAALVEEMKALPDRLAAAETAAKCIIPPLAEEFCTATGFLFVARGTGLPYAAEGALKLKELSYRWAQHYAAGELKHGPLALVCPGTPVVVVESGDSKLAANVAEIEARGGRIISVGSEGSGIPVVTNPLAPWGPLESVVPLQIFARTMGLVLGWDVDKPRNLAKSVTVE